MARVTASSRIFASFALRRPMCLEVALLYGVFLSSSSSSRICSSTLLIAADTDMRGSYLLMSVMKITKRRENSGPYRVQIVRSEGWPEKGGFKTGLNTIKTNNLEHVGAMRCYSVDRPIMQDSHSC